jgi:hypothetical protein
MLKWNMDRIADSMVVVFVKDETETKVYFRTEKNESGSMSLSTFPLTNEVIKIFGESNFNSLGYFSDKGKFLYYYKRKIPKDKWELKKTAEGLYNCGGFLFISLEEVMIKITEAESIVKKMIQRNNLVARLKAS